MDTVIGLVAGAIFGCAFGFIVGVILAGGKDDENTIRENQDAY